MLPVRTGSRTYRFGAFEADLDTLELRKHGLRLKLASQPFQVLSLLLESSGTVVTRKKLQEVLWPGESFGDHEHRLNKAVNKLRDALSDSAETPRFLETIPRVGYRLLVPVTRIGDAPVPAPEVVQPAVAPPVIPLGPTDAPRADPPNRAGSVYLGIGMTALALLVTAAIALRRPTAMEGPVQTMVPSMLSTLVGAEMHPAFSPDNKQTVFVWDGEDRANYDLYVTEPGAGRPRRLTRHPGRDLFPAWSADGNSIAFLRELSPGSVQLLVLDVRSGTERTLKVLAPGSAASSIAWMPDASAVAYAENTEPGGASSAIFAADGRSGSVRQLTFPKATQQDLYPAIDPSGTQLAFLRGGDAAWWRQIYLQPLASGSQPRKLTNFYGFIDSLCWASAGELLMSAGAPARGIPHLYRVSLRDGKERDLASVRIEGQDPTVSRDGKMLAYSKRNMEQSGVFRLDLLERRAEPILTSTTPDYTVDSNAAGSRLVLSSVRSGSPQLWLFDVSNASLKQLTFLAAGASVPRWSPDGRHIAFECRLAGNSDVCVLDLDSNRMEQLTRDASRELRMNWSRDGAWVYFQSDRDGTGNLWKIPADGRGAAIQVTREGGTFGAESWDGRYLYYFTRPGPSALRRRDVSSGVEIEIDGAAMGGGALSVTPGGVFYFSSPGSEGQQVMFYDGHIGRTRALFQVRHPVHPVLSASADGRYVFYTRLDKADSDLRLIANFR